MPNDILPKWTHWQLIENDSAKPVELGAILRDFTGQEWIYCGSTPPTRHRQNTATRGMVHVQRRNAIDELEAIDLFPSVLNTHFERRPVDQTWQRTPQHDKRIANGDDYAGDAWHNSQTGEIKMVAVNHGPPKTGHYLENTHLDIEEEP